MNTSTARQECATLSLYTTSRTTDTAPMYQSSFAGCQNFTALTSLHCSIRSRVKLNFIHVCAVSMLVGASRNSSRFDCRHGLNEDVLDSVYVPILLYCCTRIQNVDLAIILSDSGERMHRDKIPPQRMHAAWRIVTRVSCCTIISALRSSTATTVKANVVWNRWSRCYAPQMRENLLPENRRLHQEILVQTIRFAVLWGCTWTINRISRQSIVAITWHFSQQTLLELLTVDDRSERFLFR